MTDHVYKRLDELHLRDGDVVLTPGGNAFAVRMIDDLFFDKADGEPLDIDGCPFRVVYRADAPVQRSAEVQPAMTQAQLERMKVRASIAMRATPDDLGDKKYTGKSWIDARVAYADDMLKALGWSE